MNIAKGAGLASPLPRAGAASVSCTGDFFFSPSIVVTNYTINTEADPWSNLA